eukprot:5315267-Amphidinium_carterae.1
MQAFIVARKGDLWHQTVPFRCPPGGWGRARCRALFSIMCAAADALVQECQQRFSHTRSRNPYSSMGCPLRGACNSVCVRVDDDYLWKVLQLFVRIS